MLTDIPYDVVNRESGGLRNLDKGDADHAGFDLKQFLNEAIRITKGSFYIFCSTEQVSQIRSTLASAGCSTRLCIWEKTNPSPMNGQYIWLSGVECCVYGKFKGAPFHEHCKNTVFRYPAGRNQFHPTQKPVPLLRQFILASSNPGDIVFDPCMGSGSTGVACMETGRKFAGAEIKRQWFETSQSRIKDAYMANRTNNEVVIS